MRWILTGASRSGSSVAMTPARARPCRIAPGRDMEKYIEQFREWLIFLATIMLLYFVSVTQSQQMTNKFAIIELAQVERIFVDVARDAHHYQTQTFSSGHVEHAA